MLGTNLFLVALTFATSAKAFFYYKPNSLCHLSGSCEDKRAVDADAEPLSLKIVQRLPEVNCPELDIERC
jgi:hypothetical protein